MPTIRPTRLPTAMAIASGLAAASPVAISQDVGIQTVYATEKGACGRGPETRIEITQGRITGPGFDCTLGDGRPAGTGLVAHEARCTVDGKTTSEGISLDLGNYRDHFELALPGRANWLKLYPCTPVPGLN